MRELIAAGLPVRRLTVTCRPPIRPRTRSGRSVPRRRTMPGSGRGYAPLSRVVLLSAVLALGALVLPTSASAALSTSVVAATAAGPNAAMTEGDVGAACPGRFVFGGGARMDQSVLSNGVHLVGSFPTTDAVGQSANGDLSPTAWLAAGGIGGQAASAVSTWSYAICVDAAPAFTQVVVASTAGPSGTFTGVLATATCPPGLRLLSGGARTTPGTVGSLKPSGSFPSDASGAPILSGANPTSWTAVGLNGGAGDASNTTYAFAICATAGDANPTITVQNARVAGPTAASSGAVATTTCPAGTALVGGGAYISDRFALAGSQGDHLTGSFPSDPGWNACHRRRRQFVDGQLAQRRNRLERPHGYERVGAVRRRTRRRWWRRAATAAAASARRRSCRP